MIVITQGKKKTYINSENLKSVSYDEDNNEATIRYTDNEVITYLRVNSLEFKDGKL